MHTNPIEALEDRGATYGLLARLFNREVDEDLLEALGNLPLGDETSSDAIDEGSRLMRAYLAEERPDTIRELAVDFARLFIVRTARTANAPYPFESVHTAPDRTTMGDARDRALAAYREEGLDKSPSWTLPEDHVSLELEFEQTLCLRAAEALRREDETEAARLLAKQRAFLANHLNNWVPAFAETMEAYARTEFYRGLALFLTGFLEEDGAYLDALLG
ncbi:TorD/DmsD family molecular chaperone [Raoultibacter timonensis]|uniref:TorD/DmsD family molecular chaperone n=1 Tax=Raoultibacter timonensis TaxID=1907662 RepID=UPI0026DAADFA|nr:molecular chaperone TorD family protein [Raoultibacter timonensis]